MSRIYFYIQYFELKILYLIYTFLTFLSGKIHEKHRKIYLKLKISKEWNK